MITVQLATIASWQNWVLISQYTMELSFPTLSYCLNFFLSVKKSVFFLNCTKALWIKPCCMTQINIAAGFQFLVSFLHWRTEVAKECIQTILNESQVRRWWWAHCGSLSWNLDAVCDGAPALVGFKVRGTIGEFSLNNGCSNFLFY